MRRILVGIGVSLVCILALWLGTTVVAQQIRPSLPRNLGAAVFDEPLAAPFIPGADEEIPLPVESSPLANEAPDAAEVEKLAKLREKLRTIVDEKAGLMNAAALEAEIAIHERQVMELKALLELQRLQRSLEELGEKYPDSDAARRVQQILNQLRRGRESEMFPQPTEGFAPPFSPYGPYPQPRSRGFDNRVPQRQPAPSFPDPGLDESPFDGVPPAPAPNRGPRT